MNQGIVCRAPAWVGPGKRTAWHVTATAMASSPQHPRGAEPGAGGTPLGSAKARLGQAPSVGQGPSRGSCGYVWGWGQWVLRSCGDVHRLAGPTSSWAGLLPTELQTTAIDPGSLNIGEGMVVPWSRHRALGTAGAMPSTSQPGRLLKCGRHQARPAGGAAGRPGGPSG